ncbi:MAG: hypothetical protein R2828_18135 [Saprospiraceae bacterium]
MLKPWFVKYKFLCFSMAFLSPSMLLPQPGRITGNQIPITSLDNLAQGRLYPPFYPSIQGNQYLMPGWVLGEVQIQDKTYPALPLLYDIFADELILLQRQEKTFHLIRLIKEYIPYFYLGDRRFINLDFSQYKELGLKKGYYEVLFEGKLSLLVKRTHAIKTEDAITSFQRKDFRFLIRQGQAYRVANKKTFLEAIEETDKKTIASFMRKEKIRLKKADDQQWLQLIMYLNTLQLN